MATLFRNRNKLWLGETKDKQLFMDWSYDFNQTREEYITFYKGQADQRADENSKLVLVLVYTLFSHRDTKFN